jgi:hypothetical protein
MWFCSVFSPINVISQLMWLIYCQDTSWIIHVVGSVKINGSNW